MLSDIVKDGIRAAAIITRIRALTKKSTSERTSLRLEDVIAEILVLADHELVKQGISIKTEFEPNLPNVSGDRVQLQQVLLNLVMNSTEAMSDVEGSNRIMTIRQQRDLLAGKPGVLLTIQDSGRGLDPEDVDRLFEAFYSTKPHGMGMGLRISRSIVEAHGGRLWATPNAGPGATFSFTLPAENGETGSTATPTFHHQPSDAL